MLYNKNANSMIFDFITKLFLISGVILILDAIYLTTFSSYFGKVFRNIQGTPMKLKLHGAILCYLFIILSLYYFAFHKKMQKIDIFLLGFFTYGIYELTNYSTLNAWPINMIILDTLWGGILYVSTFVIVEKVWLLVK